VSLEAADLRSLETHVPLVAWRAVDPWAHFRMLLNALEDIHEVLALSLEEVLNAAALVEFAAVHKVSVDA